MTDVERWREEMSQAFVPLQVSCVERERFAGEMSTHQMGRLMVASLRSSPQRIDRTRALIAGSDRELWQIALCRSGCLYLDQDERQVCLNPGDLVAYETARPFRWSFDGTWAATVLTLPRADIALTSAESRALTARGLPGGAGAGGLISRLLSDVADNAPTLSLSSQDRIIDDLSDLILTLLQDCVGARTAGPPSLRAQLAQVKDYIGTQLRHPGLTPSSIAVAQHMSVRHLHALFADEPTSVAAYIRGRRLRNCARDLLDSRLGGVPIAALAMRNGFGDTRGFERAFKSAYGMTPGEYRGRPPG